MVGWMDRDMFLVKRRAIEIVVSVVGMHQIDRLHFIQLEGATKVHFASRSKTKFVSAKRADFSAISDCSSTKSIS
jgi:hypothetical protein